MESGVAIRILVVELATNRGTKTKPGSSVIAPPFQLKKSSRASARRYGFLGSIARPWKKIMRDARPRAGTHRVTLALVSHILFIHFEAFHLCAV